MLLRNYPCTQKLVYFPAHLNLTSASALRCRTRKHGNSIFSLKRSIIALPDFNQSMTRNSYSRCSVTPCVFTVYAIVWPWAVERPWSQGARKSRVSLFSSWFVLHARCAAALSSWKTKFSTTTCLTAANVFSDSIGLNYVSNSVHWLSLYVTVEHFPFLKRQHTPREFAKVDHVCSRWLGAMPLFMALFCAYSRPFCK